MKTPPSKFLRLPAVLGLVLLSTPPVFSADSPITAPAVSTESLSTQMNHLVAAVQAKLDKDKTTEADLAPELMQFDTIFAAHKNEKTDAVAEILYAKAMLYAEVINVPDKAKPILEQLKTDFPNTRYGQQASQIIAQIGQQAESNKIQNALAVGTKFPDFDVKAVDGKALSVAGDKGKVIMIDFWATWCGPCVEEFPNVLATYTKYHAKGFDIIGVSLDSDKSPLTKFIQDKKVTWPQFYDGKEWKNELAVKYGVNSIPATYLLDSQGNIIGKNLRGDALEKAVAAALAK